MESTVNRSGASNGETCGLRIDVMLRRMSRWGKLHRFRFVEPGSFRIVPPLSVFSCEKAIGMQLTTTSLVGTREVVLYVPFGKIVHAPRGWIRERLCVMKLGEGERRVALLQLTKRDFCHYAAFQSSIVIADVAGGHRYRFLLGQEHPGFLRTPPFLVIGQDPVTMTVTNRMHPDLPIEIYVSDKERRRLRWKKIGFNTWDVWIEGNETLRNAEVCLVDNVSGYGELVPVSKLGDQNES